MPPIKKEKTVFKLQELIENQIPAAHKLSVEIFGQDASDEKHSIEKWKEHLKQNGLLLGAFVDDKLVGFKFGYEREPSSFHSWLAGVSDLYRGRGIMTALMESQEAWAKSHGYRFLTVNTYRESFPAMYNLLIDTGYQEIEQKAGKSLFRKELL